MAKQKRQTGPERRRQLVEINLVSESKPGQARSTRGCFHLFGSLLVVVALGATLLLSLR
jgi:hypothetical protein